MKKIEEMREMKREFATEVTKNIKKYKMKEITRKQKRNDLWREL